MSIVEPTLHSFARAAVVSVVTLTVLFMSGQGLRAIRHLHRSLFFWPAMATFLIPGFAVAFTYFDVAMRDQGLMRDCYYVFMMTLRLAPLALIIVGLTPPGISHQAMHCLRLGGSLPWWRRRRWDLRAWGRGLWIGVAVVSFLTFQEFEIATTWNMRAWPVSLFDAQAGGLALGDSLRLAALPFAIQAAFVASFGFLFQLEPPGETPGSVPFSKLETATLVTQLGRALIFGLPLCLVLFGTCYGARRNPSRLMTLAPWREILSTLILTSASTALTWLLAGWIEKRRGWRWLLALPGLFGSLLTGLLLLAALQVPPLHLLRDTIFPTVLGLALVLLPFALLLRFGIKTTSDRAALQVAYASGARRALWQLDGWPRLCAVLMLFGYGYGDFTINSLLAPPQFTSASVRLLNLLHYGRSDALMAMFILAFAAPLAAALLTALVARLYPRRRAS